MVKTTAVATRDTATEIEHAGNDNGGHPLVLLRTQLQQRADEFKAVLPAHISPEKLQRTVLTAVQQNPDLLRCSRQSFITSCMKAAQDGLLPDGREAALVKFTTRQQTNGEWRSVDLVQYMPMVYGLRKKILQSGEVRDLQANVVYRQEVEAGLFIYEEGTERCLRHKPLLDPDFDPTDDDICAAYSVATYADGSQSFEVMRRADINKVREASQTGATRDRHGKPRTPKGPWVDWFAEMAKKTVIRRHSKTLPMSGDLIDVEAFDEALAARSTTQVLEAVDEEPARLAIPPRRDEVEVIDQETGEVTTQPSDAADGSDGDDAGSDNEADLEEEPTNEAEEPAVEQRGENDDPRANADRLIAEARGKELLPDLKRFEASKEFNAAYDTLDDDLKLEVDGEIAQVRARLSGGK